MTTKELCRELRKNQTPAEKALWKLLRNRRLERYKFLRQHPLVKTNMEGWQSCFIADFYCAEKKLVIEADGPMHLQRREYDKNRDEVLNYYNILTLRFTNEEVLMQSEKVIGQIWTTLESR